MQEQGARNNEQEESRQLPWTKHLLPGQKTPPSLAGEPGTSVPSHWPSWQPHHPVRGTLILYLVLKSSTRSCMFLSSPSRRPLSARSPSSCRRRLPM